MLKDINHHNLYQTFNQNKTSTVIIHYKIMNDSTLTWNTGFFPKNLVPIVIILQEPKS